MSGPSINDNSKKSAEISMNNRYPESKQQSKLRNYDHIFMLLNEIDTEEFLAKYGLAPQTDTNAFQP